MTASDAPRSTTSTRLAYLLKHAQRSMSELHAEALEPLGIHERDLGVMLAIDRFAPSSQQQIAERMGVDRTTMVAIIDALEAKAIVERRPDRDDRRRNVIALTTTGRDILREATVASDAAEAELLAPLSTPEREQFRDLLARVLAHRRA